MSGSLGFILVTTADEASAATAVEALPATGSQVITEQAPKAGRTTRSRKKKAEPPAATIGECWITLLFVLAKHSSLCVS